MFRTQSKGTGVQGRELGRRGQGPGPRLAHDLESLAHSELLIP